MTLHTDRHFEDELQSLQELLLRMGGLVERQIAHAIESLVERDSELAREVIARDREVNRLDILIDEECLKVIALHQPAAGDLRFVTTALKVNTDLERIGDMAVNICERALELNDEPMLKPYIDVPNMAKEAQQMVRTSLDALVRRDTALARRVIEQDDVVDGYAHQLYRELLSFMVEEPKTISRATRILLVSKYLERIADHATNIAEMVVFMVDGKMIRHAASLPRGGAELA
ncbi:MAG: phosphate signaling complex protein PhoU [Deltaproteobacteria bacterium]|nr:phosphate signaling complex protein PhoU [Deltaproteobacteria bacterium]